MTKNHILICDDDEGIIDVMRIVLEAKGYLVKQLTQSRDIFKIINNWKPNLILVDLWMPEVSGNEIVKELKKNPSTKHIPIILVAAHRRTPEVAQDCGADGYLAKPFDISDLENIVEQYIGGTR